MRVVGVFEGGSEGVLRAADAVVRLVVEEVRMALPARLGGCEHLAEWVVSGVVGHRESSSGRLAADDTSAHGPDAEAERGEQACGEEAGVAQGAPHRLPQGAPPEGAY